MAGRPKRRGGLSLVPTLAKGMKDDDVIAERDAAPHQTLEDWLTLPEDMRDDFAARALYESFGRHNLAAMRLGFAFGYDINKANLEAKAERASILAAVFGTPGVKRRLENTFEDEAANRKAIVARVTSIALHGADELALKAAKTLADYTGDRADKNNAINFHLWGLVAGKNAQVAGNGKPQPKAVTHDQEPTLPTAESPSAILSHEPGAPTRVVDEQVEAATTGNDE